MRRYDVIENGQSVMTVINLTEEPVECGMCSRVDFHRHAVSYYEEPCCSEHPERGGHIVCRECHDKWAKWDDQILELAQWHGQAVVQYARYPHIPRPKPITVWVMT